MKKRYLGLIMAMLLILNAALISGCALDTSRVAGSMTVNSSEEEQVQPPEENAESPADKVQVPAENAEPSADKSINPHNEPQLKDVKYDSTEFLKPLSAWNGQPYCEINGNKPDFTDNEIWTSTQESLDPLDALGRCGTANSCIGTDGMPTGGRGNISEIHPTGWHSDSYEGIEGEKLFNRCHLIGHKLSGDDAIARNLITGTSYMNRQGMLPFEDAIYEYVKSTGNHVMYRVTPCFAGDNLVAHGVHMQAVSVEDKGDGISFNVFCYNVQPGIEIDYATGDNRLAGDTAIRDQSGENNEHAMTEEPLPENSGSSAEAQTSNGAVSGESQDGNNAKAATYVLNMNTRKFHYPDCNSVKQMKDKNKEVVEKTRDEVISMGYDPCGNCHP